MLVLKLIQVDKRSPGLKSHFSSIGNSRLGLNVIGLRIFCITIFALFALQMSVSRCVAKTTRATSGENYRWNEYRMSVHWEIYNSRRAILNHNFVNDMITHNYMQRHVNCNQRWSLHALKNIGSNGHNCNTFWATYFKHFNLFYF